MSVAILDNLVEQFIQLDIENQEYLVDIFQNQLKERKRAVFLEEINNAEANFASGRYKTGSVENFFADLDND